MTLGLAVGVYGACARGRKAEAPLSGGTLALTKDGSREKVEDMGKLAKVAHGRRCQV